MTPDGRRSAAGADRNVADLHRNDRNLHTVFTRMDGAPCERAALRRSDGEQLGDAGQRAEREAGQKVADAPQAPDRQAAGTGQDVAEDGETVAAAGQRAEEAPDEGEVAGRHGAEQLGDDRESGGGYAAQRASRSATRAGGPTRVTSAMSPSGTEAAASFRRRQKRMLGSSCWGRS